MSNKDSRVQVLQNLKTILRLTTMNELAKNIENQLTCETAEIQLLVYMVTDMAAELNMSPDYWEPVSVVPLQFGLLDAVEGLEAACVHRRFFATGQHDISIGGYLYYIWQILVNLTRCLGNKTSYTTTDWKWKPAGDSK